MTWERRRAWVLWVAVWCGLVGTCLYGLATWQEGEAHNWLALCGWMFALVAANANLDRTP